MEFTFVSDTEQRIKPVIYQLVVRYFGNTTTANEPSGSLAVNGCGTFADIDRAALDSLRSLGATHVWLTGVLRQATLTDHGGLGLPPDDPDVVKGVAGSFYAVRDYFDVCPDYAVDPVHRLDEFRALVQRVHAAGMKALIDFIPNHVARGYHSVVRPDLDFGIGDDTGRSFSPANHFFYVTDQPGEPLRLTKPAHWNPFGYVFDGHFPPENGSPEHPVKVTGNNIPFTFLSTDPWYETIKLNYGYDFLKQTAHYDPRPRTWDLADTILAYWQSFGVDGFRCDFAHYVPGEAWKFLVDRARQRDANVYFMAEAYPWQGSGDPVTHRYQLTDAGFDGVYDNLSYDRLKNIYTGRGGQDDYDGHVTHLTPAARQGSVQYLENHDERRIASPVVHDHGPNASGFGTADAGYLLAPLQYLSGPGAVLVLNGQEIGEPGDDAEGFAVRDGRTTLFDYWAMPEFVKWVNGHAYDGGGLADWQKRLRQYYAGVLTLCQDPAVCGDGFWGLKYVNRPETHGDCPEAFYSFARFDAAGRRLLLVVANFDRGRPATGRIRLPRELLDACGLSGPVSVRLRLDRDGAKDEAVGQFDTDGMVADGILTTVPAETSHVYAVGPA